MDDIYQILIMFSEGPGLQVLKGLKLNIMCTGSSVKSHMYAKYRREIQQLQEPFVNFLEVFF